MELINVSTEISGFLIKARIIYAGEDIIIIIGGGKHHIGAVGISFPTESIVTGETTITTSVVTLPSHKDDIVAKKVSEKVSKKLNRKVTVIAGIHFDNLSKDDIGKILEACDKLTDKIIEKLK
jgi:hypothetical protein